MKNGHVVNKRQNSYLGCEVPRTFLLRFQAFAEIQGIDKRLLIAKAVEDAVVRFESKLDPRKSQAYDALLEAKANQNGVSVNEVKAELELVRARGGRRSVTKSPTWPFKPGAKGKRK